MSVPSALNTAWGRFLGFWFAPKDPTTMAFIRIVTGCLALYVHLVYTFDLNAFFGRDAWYDLDTSNRQRWEEPVRHPPLGWEHEDLIRSAQFPDGEGARRAVFAWVRSLPADKAELAARLRLIDEAGVIPGETRNGVSIPGDRPLYPPSGYPFPFSWFTLEYALGLSPNPDVRATTLKSLTKEIPRDKFDPVPEVFDRLKEEDLKALARDLDAFASTLPADSVQDRRVIVTYLQNLGTTLRDNLLAFLRDTTADKVPAFERERRIAYLERWGYEERFVSQSGSPLFSIWFHVTEPGEMAVVHGLVLLVMLMFTVGLFTRITSVLTWLAAVSYLHRDPQVLFGQDTMMNILLIYLMIANSGAALSLDRVIARYRAARASVARGGGIDAPAAAFLAAPPPSVASGFAQRLLQVHFCFIYMASGLSKLKGGTWWSGDAMWLTLMNPEFTMIHFEWYQNLLRWMFSSRPVYSVVAAGGVLFTLFVEIGLPYLVWTRLRPYIIVGGFLLHFGIGVFMGLLVFSLFMMTMLVSYIPAAAIREVLFGNGTPVPDAQKKKLAVNRTDPKSVHAAAAAVAFDMRGRVELVRG